MIRIAIFVAAFLFPFSALAQAASDSNSAQLRWLDRTTGALNDFTLTVGQTETFGPLQIRLSACRYPRGAINRDAYAYLTIRDVNLDLENFSGWMVASSPGLNALEHPRYDVWVIRCRTS